MSAKVVVLGGGISGLASAWFLKRRYGNDVDITLLEGSNRLGGWIRTVVSDGFLFELGPRSCRAAGAGLETLRLVEQLGLEDQVVVAAPSAHRRYLYTQGRLQQLPTGFLSFLTSSLTRPLLWPLMKEWRVPASAAADESIHAFIERRLGSHAANILMDPLVSGVFAGDAKSLSLKSCFPILHKWEMQSGSIIKGMFTSRDKGSLSPFIKSIQRAGLFSFKKGMQQLVDTLGDRLQADIRLDCQVVAIKRDGIGFFIETSSGEVFKADQVVSALPAKALAKVTVGLDEGLSTVLRGIRSTSVAAVSIGYRRQVLRHEGFGYLIPSQEQEQLLGMVWDSSAFPQHNGSPSETRITCMVGGEHMADFETYSSEDFKRITLEGLKRHLGIHDVPDTLFVTVARQAIPQYTLGHSGRVSAIRGIIPNLTIVGNSYSGISVNDCIKEAALHHLPLSQ